MSAMSPWAAVLLFLIVGILFTAGGIGTARLIQPRKRSEEKLEVYECGVDTIGPTWVQFRTSYFLYALLFLIFDVEAIFLLPWAVKFQAMLGSAAFGFFAFGEMIVFIGILVIGLWYAWKEGALEWD